MKRANLRGLLSIPLLVAVVAPAGAQSPEDEIAKLRQMLRLPEAASIAVAASPTLPAVTPVRLFIATGLDLGVRQNFLKWADDWTRKDANKHGAIQLVSDLASADVILARLADRDKAKTATNTALETGVIYDIETRKVRTTPYAREYSYTEVPVVAYILARSGPDSVGIVWRYASVTGADEDKNSGKRLWEDFKTLMKNRPKLAR